MPLTVETKDGIRRLSETAAGFADTTGPYGAMAAALLRGPLIGFLEQAAEKLGLRMTFDVVAAPGAQVSGTADFRTKQP